MNKLEAQEYWYPLTDIIGESGYQYKAEIGCSAKAQPNSIRDVKVAGYSISDLALLFAYKTGEDGLLIKDADHTALISAVYLLEPENPEAVYTDLISKLTSLYGDVDLQKHTTVYDSYEQNQWNGAEGTMVSLIRVDYYRGGHGIMIMYAFDGYEKLLADADAYKAIGLEETRNAASDMDGL